LFRLIYEHRDRLAPIGTGTDDTGETRRLVHKTVAAVTEDLEQFRFNRGVARLRELSNHLEGVAGTVDGAVLREALEVLATLIGPMMPHLAEELWRLMGHDALLIDQPWPVADQSLVRDDTVKLAVQVNGKLRATLDLPRDVDQEQARVAALAMPEVQRMLEGKPVRKVVVVPNRVINVVA
jgi:leucyl-tRNA synthetase